MRLALPAMLCAAALLALNAPADAGALRVTPVSVELSPARAAAVMTLTNADTQPMNVQLRVFRWTQVNGEDRLEPTRSVVASPPSVSLAPGAQQIVRLVHTRPSGDAAGEQSFRVLVDELPDPNRARPGEVAMVLRQSIPIFFGDGAARPDLKWSRQATSTGVQLTARNTGERRIRLSDVKIQLADGAVAASRGGLVGYVLPGAEMRWLIPLTQQNAAEALSLSVNTDLGPLRAPLPPPAPPR